MFGYQSTNVYSYWLKIHLVSTNEEAYIPTSNISSITKGNTKESSVITMLNGDKFEIHGTPEQIIQEITRK